MQTVDKGQKDNAAVPKMAEIEGSDSSQSLMFPWGSNFRQYLYTAKVRIRVL